MAAHASVRTTQLYDRDARRSREDQYLRLIAAVGGYRKTEQATSTIADPSDP
jgi:hypothetical protein